MNLLRPYHFNNIPYKEIRQPKLICFSPFHIVRFAPYFSSFISNNVSIVLPRHWNTNKINSNIISLCSHRITDKPYTNSNPKDPPLTGTSLILRRSIMRYMRRGSFSGSNLFWTDSGLMSLHPMLFVEFVANVTCIRRKIDRACRGLMSPIMFMLYLRTVAYCGGYFFNLCHISAVDIPIPNPR